MSALQIELSKFLTETGILGEEHSNAILRIFVDSHIRSNKSRGGRPSIHSEIHRHEFFVALIKIAILKNVTIPKKEAARLRKKGMQVSSISKTKLPSAPEALEMIYEDFLSPVLEHMPAGSKMRAAVGSDSVMILIYDNLTELAKSFEKYAESDNEEEAGVTNSTALELAAKESSFSTGEVSQVPDGSMNVKCFGAFAEDAGFVDSGVAVRRFSVRGRKHSIMGNRTSCSITQKDVRQIFSASQHDSDEANETEQKKVDDDDNISSHHELMIFSEFLEAIARLGVLKYQTKKKEVEVQELDDGAGEKTLSHYECIKLAIDQVCSMK